jgi:hypothetical protein
VDCFAMHENRCRGNQERWILWHGGSIWMYREPNNGPHKVKGQLPNHSHHWTLEPVLTLPFSIWPVLCPQTTTTLPATDLMKAFFVAIWFGLWEQDMRKGELDWKEASNNRTLLNVNIVTCMN